MTTTEEPQETTRICGYGYKDGTVCYDPRPHEQHQGLACVSCGGLAVRECSSLRADLSSCGEHLCPGCLHDTETGKHEVVPTEASIVRAEMIEAMARGLDEAIRRGICRVPEEYRLPVAGMLLDHISTHINHKVLSGMAMPHEDFGGRRK